VKRSGPPQRRTPLKRTEWGCDGSCPPGPRSSGLKRSRIKPKKIERDWSSALEKKAREGKCRVCGSTDGLAAAHTIGREHDAPIGDPSFCVYKVEADDTVPLCRRHHDAYDARQLDLLPYLNNVEQARAVLHVGLEAARKRLTSGL